MQTRFLVTLRRAASIAAGTWAGCVLTGCLAMPSPLSPKDADSIGLAHRGVLHRGVALEPSGPGYRFLRANDRHSATPRLAAALTRAAKSVYDARPESTLVLGDLSQPQGGVISHHASHRSGRDADTLYYTRSLDGRPLPSPGFVRIGDDGLGYDDASGQFVALDVERQWLFVKALITDRDANVQWLFCSEGIKRMILRWARARGESTELVWRAAQVLHQPTGARPHDDHMHVRIDCTADDRARGCVSWGPAWPWLESGDRTRHARAVGESELELARELLRPLPPAFGEASPAEAQGG